MIVDNAARTRPYRHDGTPVPHVQQAEHDRPPAATQPSLLAIHVPLITLPFTQQVPHSSKRDLPTERKSRK